jgi:hypothetical protein
MIPTDCTTPRIDHRTEVSGERSRQGEEAERRWHDEGGIRPQLLLPHYLCVLLVVENSTYSRLAILTINSSVQNLFNDSIRSLRGERRISQIPSAVLVTSLIPSPILR